MDNLHIKALTVTTHIGVYSWEQKITQKLWIDITIPGNFSGCNDEIAKTLDYAKLCQLVTQYVETNRFQLIETVADKVADLIKVEFNVEQITVSVSKPYAVKNASDVRVTVTR